MKLRWLVGVLAVLVLLLVPAVCFAQEQNALDKPGTKAGETATGPDGGVYVWVPAGEFNRGDKITKRHIRISKGFWLGKCTVTNAHYQRYCQETGVEFPKGSDQGDNHPVVFVDRAEAKAYCKHYGLALPTEAQWEYAARGPESRKWPWGNQWDEDKCCNLGNQGPKGRTFPVGSFPEGASWCGALDMAGNVWEWCKDWFDPDYYKYSPDTDPPGPDSCPPDITECWGLRGGAWDDDAHSCLSFMRCIGGARCNSRGLRASRTP